MSKFWKTKETLQPIGRFEVARVGLGRCRCRIAVWDCLRTLCLFLIGSCVVAPPPPPKNGLTVKFDSLKMTHAFSRSVLHVVSRNAQCPSKKNQFLLLARIDAKNAIICVGLEEKLQGPYRYVTSRNSGKPSRKNCQLGRALEEYVYFKLKYEIGSNYILSFC